MKLKKLNEQIIVITGATSGIGLTTARAAAKAGAKLILVARNETALRELTDEIKAAGGQAVYAAGDVADEATLKRAADLAKENFGGFDTWVNNAGGAVYGRLTDVPVEDMRRLFETNFWGVVNGSLVAAEHLRSKGGAIINLGSEVSDAPVPLQTVYSSSKHAVKGFTDTLRMELEGDELPISVSLIKPTAIHTPFPENAKNYLPYEPQLPPPLYAPELVAEAILYCAENPKRDFFVGGMAKAHSSMALNAPRAYDKMNEMILNSAQDSGETSEPNRPDGLYQPNSKLNERGSQDRFVREHSVYQQTNLHPLISVGLLLGAGFGIAALLGARGKSKNGENGKHRVNGARNFKPNRNLKIAEHAEVVGSDGAHVGTVDHDLGDRIKLRKRDANAAGMHHEIPTAWVESVDSDETVRLNKTADEAIEQWTTSEKDMTEFKDSLNTLARHGGGSM